MGGVNVSKLNWLLIGLFISVVLTAGAVYRERTKHDRQGAVGNVFGLTDSDQKAYAESDDFEKKKKPNTGDWLAQHHEPGQTYGEYLKAEYNLPDNKRKVIYVLPLGEFGKDAPSLATLLEYAQAYYHPMSVKLLGNVAGEKVKAESRLNRGTKQWLAPDILIWMEPWLPKDAYAMIAVTMTDLYPDPKWNYVFGIASTRARVGVFSFARYIDKDKKLVLRRAGKVLTHETGHMFGIKHCVFYECNMNGGNHLREMDATPLHLCPVCLRKMQHALGFEIQARYKKLSQFYKKYGLENERLWIDKRLKRISE